MCIHLIVITLLNIQATFIVQHLSKYVYFTINPAQIIVYNWFGSFCNSYDELSTYTKAFVSILRKKSEFMFVPTHTYAFIAIKDTHSIYITILPLNEPDLYTVNSYTHETLQKFYFRFAIFNYQLILSL